MIIEIYGDFWHCNEEVETRWKSESFKINGKNKTEIREKDEMDKLYAIDNGYNIRCFWASEIEGKGGGDISLS